MKALQQGELDCLCGIYSIVNAVYFVSNKKIRRKSLFNELLLAYMNNWGIYDLLTNGLDVYQMKYLLNHIATIYPHIDITPLNIKRRSKLTSLIRLNFENIPKNTIFIFSTSTHWSLIKNYKNDKLILFDSCNIKQVDISDIVLNTIFKISFIS